MDLVLRPQLTLSDLSEMVPALRRAIEAIPSRREEIAECAEILIKYSGYIQREREQAEKLERLEYVFSPRGARLRRDTSAEHGGTAEARPHPPAHHRSGLAYPRYLTPRRERSCSSSRAAKLARSAATTCVEVHEIYT